MLCKTFYPLNGREIADLKRDINEAVIEKIPALTLGTDEIGWLLQEHFRLEEMEYNLPEED